MARECDFCASVRQKKIADQAEKVEAQYGQLTMTVLVPHDNTAGAVKALHASFMRRSLAVAGIWTVETGGQFAGLHVNYLSPKPLPAKWSKCETYSELLRVTARDAAAYIAKRYGMPAVEQYDGRLYGAWGKVSDILASDNVAPVVQAAAIETVLSGGATIMQNHQKQSGEVIDYRTADEEREGWIEGTPVNGRRVWWSAKDCTKCTWKHPRADHTVAVRKEVMRRHLPNLYAAIGKSV